VGCAWTENSELSPEQPPALTCRRKPDWAEPPLKRTMRRMNFSAAGVMVMFIGPPYAW
jgi:hypothetical protein